MKAQEAEIVAGIISKSGLKPSPTDAEAIIGSTSSVIAVLDVSSVRKVMPKDVPSMRNGGEVASTVSKIPPIQEARPDSTKLAARAKPPPNSSMMPRAGTSTSGRREVAGMGRASVIHQIAMRPAIPAILLTEGLDGSRSTKKTKRTNIESPRKNPAVFLILKGFFSRSKRVYRTSRNTNDSLKKEFDAAAGKAEIVFISGIEKFKGHMPG